MDRRISTRFALQDDGEAIDGLLRMRTDTDSRSALTEYKARRRGTADVEIVAAAGEEVIGYAIAAHHGDRTAGAEMVTRPGDAAEPIARALIDALRRAIPAKTKAYLWVWRAAERSAAAAAGLRIERVLAMMERILRPEDVREPDPPDGILVRTFRSGDESSWLEANRMAFHDHPETGAIDRDELDARMREPWFDPAGFLLAEDRNGRVLGYCWTKLHPGGVGEIYIIGVVPDARGLGLGTLLLDAGLADLAGRQGAERAMLYMDGEDGKLISFYEKQGFEKSFEQLAYGLEPDGGGG